MTPDKPAPKSPWAVSCDDLLAQLEADAVRGLSTDQVRERLQQYGPNRLREHKSRSVWIILRNQLRSLIVALLAGATLLSLFFQQWMEAAAIAVVIVINTLIGFMGEWRATRSMEALRQLGAAKAIVRRDGTSVSVDAYSLVPGDIVLLEAGDSVNADLRLIEESKLEANESALTGESLPIAKRLETLAADTELHDRANMLYKGTFVTRGAGAAVVIGTGMNTELGRITSLVQEASEAEFTPLEKRLNRLGRELIWITLGMVVLLSFLGVARGHDLYLMIETSIALAVSAIPEGLSIVATIALARGMLWLSRRHALVRQLSAVETLGATSIIGTDKTGTLTENRMTVTRVVTENEADERELLETGVLCNNASLSVASESSEITGTGDPMEVALLAVANERGITQETLLEAFPEAREVAFDPDDKMMATYHKSDGGFRVAVKGAPEELIEAALDVRNGTETIRLDIGEETRWLERVDEMARQGLRVLALATKKVDSVEAKPYTDLTLLGLVGIEDPPRADAMPAIASCKHAGIRVIMITGDQPATARKIALDVGIIDDENAPVVLGKEMEDLFDQPEPERRRILEADVIARATPKQKLDLIQAHQERGSIIAMTGDGVNDAPALEKADIGVAMGIRGTQVAREVADMVLKDDSLSSIVAAVREGRVIFANIQKFIFYLFSCNASEVIVVAMASLANAPLPLLPLQILFLNLVTDVFPALALGVSVGSASVMDQRPRGPKEPLLPVRQWPVIVGHALVITVSVLGAMAIAMQWMEMDYGQGVTVSFLTLAFAQLWHVFNARDPETGVFRNDISENPYIWGALVICVGLILAGAFVPGLSTVLRVEAIGTKGWTLVLAMSAIPWLVGAVLHAARRRKNVLKPAKP